MGPVIVFWQNPILTFELGRISYFDIQNSDLTFELRLHIVFCPILTFELGGKSNLDIQKSWFDIQTEAAYFISTFKILFWHPDWGRISHFDIQNPILTFQIGRISYFDIQNPILTFELRPNFVFWHSKSYFDILTWADYHILSFKNFFWHSKCGRIWYFDIQNPILTFKIRYFDI